MRKKTFSLVTACLLAAFSFIPAQELPFTSKDPGGNEFRYGIEEDNPNFNDIHIRPKFTIDMDGGGEGFAAAYGIDAEYLKLPVYLRAAFHRSFTAGFGVGLVDRDPMQGLEAGAAFPLIKRIKKSKIPVVLKSTLVASDADSKTFRVTRLPVEGTHHNEILARSGFYYHRNATPEGNLTAIGGYGGIGWLSRHFLKIKSDKYGSSKQTQHILFYADAIFAPAISHDDTDLDTRSFGVRGGLYFFNGFRSMFLPWDFKLEGGLRPGASEATYFFLFDLGFPINLG